MCGEVLRSQSFFAQRVPLVLLGAPVCAFEKPNTLAIMRSGCVSQKVPSIDGGAASAVHVARARCKHGAAPQIHAELAKLLQLQSIPDIHSDSPGEAH